MKRRGAEGRTGLFVWWAGEHVVLPRPADTDSPMDPKDPILDPLVHLSYVAAWTETMELGTAVVILPSAIPWSSPSRPPTWTC